MPRDVGDVQLIETNRLARGLVYVNDHDPGLSRVGASAGFGYRDADGRPVSDEATLSRIRALVIPPAWSAVWICPTPRGHIQATGRDARGRKQYRYHEDWRQARGGVKFNRLIAFGRALPRLRARVEADLSKRGLPREKVLAAVVRLMELTLIRVGNEEYAKTNKSFGLTTLRDRHAKITTGGAVFEFRGKSGKLHSTRFQDRRLARIVKSCQDIPGQRLFQYLDEDGERRSIESTDVNAYIREAMGEDFSAKDFRTWAGTLSAAQGLIEQPPSNSASEAKRQVAVTVKAVAALLGNTAAVCRGSYIHPLILEAHERGALPLKRARSARGFELSVLKFLETAQESAT
ncbi:MAG: DNA topoisomerase IB [Phenylobacterium sp.]|uniref:DNA topoisomerase IB n=1 Tax=Phenylobacterium sp. TaxID=1871053 RepID=UPI00271F907D|nr:DNA topoisomerase IB [Phenylobacterium sp.]MDO9430024.1 DNA topoisomerase IB [Phenylobacterium sp.]